MAPKFASDFRKSDQSDFTRRYRNPGRHDNQYVYLSVTNVTGALPKVPLLNWYAKVTAEAAVHQREAWTHMSDEDATDWLKKAPLRTRDRASGRGTTVHAVIDKMLSGERYDAEAGIEDWITSAQRFIDEARPRPIQTEGTIYDERTLTAGTFDYLGYLDALPDWGLTLLDWKTSNRLYPDMGVQIVGGYAFGAQYVLDDDAKEHEWQIPKTCGIVHLGKWGYAIHPVPMDRIFRRAFLGALEIRRWEDEGPAIGKPVQLTLPLLTNGSGHPPEGWDADEAAERIRRQANAKPSEAEIADIKRRIRALGSDKQLALSGDLMEAGISTKTATWTVNHLDQVSAIVRLYEKGSVGHDVDVVARTRQPRI